MVQLSEFAQSVVELKPPSPRGWVEPAPDLDLDLPRVYQRPPPPLLSRPKQTVRKMLDAARNAQMNGDPPAFGKAYGALTGEFRVDLQWALSCWDYLLSTQGCRFLARDSWEKLYSRGDYRVFTRNDFEGLIHRGFRECLMNYLASPETAGFERHLREQLWPLVSEKYRALEEPADRNQRKLTAYSYLRCVPYRFLNRYHHERVYQTVGGLSFPLRQTVQLYHLSFYREEAASEQAGTHSLEFRRKRWSALRVIAGRDYLSFRLLRQIERY